MRLALYLLGIATAFLGIIGLIAPVLPGGMLIVLGVTLVAWADDFARIGWGTVGIIGVIGLVSTAIDHLAGVAGTKLAGGTKWGVFGAGVGLLVGMLLAGPWGLLLGPPLGAILFEYWKDPDFRAAWRSGLGAALGFLAGILVKLVLAVVQIGIAVWAYCF